MKKVILLLIVLMAFFLRFYKLDSYPSLNADEAAIGYNAYSLLETGKDEHGNPWPIHFQSFNDFKPGLYFYVVLPFVKVLGMNEWAVRAPGALFGVGTVVVVYLLVLELSKLGLLGKLKKHGEVIALTSAFFLAINPWHIHFSRGGWEVNVATFFITLGAWLFIKSIRNPKYYILSFLSFVAAVYTYHAARVVVPLLLLGMFVIFRNDVKINLKKVIIAGIIAFLLLIPLGADFTKGAVISRAAGVGLLADPGPLARIDEQRSEHTDFRGVNAISFHNKPINYGLAFLENWSEHYWGEFLFLSGDDIQRNKVPETGQFYLLEILFIVAGLIGIFKSLLSKDSDTRGWKLVLWWLIVSPVAAALTFQSPHALRAHNMVIPLTIISAYGLIYLSLWLHKLIRRKWMLNIIFVLFIAAIAWGFVRYLHMYHIHMAKEYPFSSQYGLQELVEYIRKEQDKHESVVITDRYDQPYILFLFYSKYPPERFQKEHRLTPRDKFGFSTVNSFDKYVFEPIDFDLSKLNYPNSLIIGADEEIPDEANVVGEIYGTNGYKYFKVVAN